MGASTGIPNALTNVNSITASASTDLTLNAGGGNQNIHILATGTGGVDFGNGFNITAAQIDRANAYVESQYSGQGGFRLFGNTAYAVSFGPTAGGGGNVSIASTGASTSPTTGALTVAGGFGVAGAINQGGKTTTYNNIATAGWGIPSINGLDNRTGLTVADGAATTIYTTVAGGGLFRITADIFATAAVTGTATYTITWTQNAGTRTMAVTATAINTLGTATNLINPDNATTITTQLTGTFTGTFTVAGVIEQLK